jgi:hypothetical protein
LTSSRDLTIGLRVVETGDYLLAPDFLATANQLLRLLTEVDIALSEYSRTTVDWAIQRLERSSPAELVLEPVVKGDDVDNRLDVIETALSGLASLSESDSRPRYFSDTALTSARGLVASLGERIQTVEVFSNGTRIECNESIAANVREILRPGREMMGSIDGYLQRMDSHAGFKFALWEPTMGTRIEGDLHPDASPELKGEIVRSYEGRVRIEGILRTNRKGEVRNVRALSLLRLRESARFQSAQEISGIYDITGGLEAEEYIRRLRDAE